MADRAKLSVHGYVAAIAALGVLLSVVAGSSVEAPGPNHPFVIAVVFTATLLGAGIPIHMRLGAETHTFSFTELPVLIASVMLSPRTSIFAIFTAALIARFVVHPLSAVKTIFNAGVLACEVASTILLVGVIAPERNVVDPRLWCAVAIAAVVANSLSASLVGVVIRLSGGRQDVKSFLRNLVIAAAGGLVMGAVAIVGMVLTNANPWSLFLSTTLAGGIVAFYRRHMTLTEQYRAVLTLERFTRGLTPASEPSEVIISALLTNAAELMNTETASIVLADRSGAIRLTRTFVASGALDATTLHCPQPTDWVWLRVITERSAVQLSSPAGNAATGVSLLRRLKARAIRSAHGTPEDGKYLSRIGVRDMLVAPLDLDESTVGVIVGCNRRNPTFRLNSAELDLVNTMANHASVNLQCSRLIETLESEVADRLYEATHDSLTGLNNRAAFNTIADKFLAALGDGQATLMLVDLNQFKKVNDTMGHHAGDEVLVQISSRLLESLPEGSTVARLGGDEFAVLVPSAHTESDALACAASLRTAIRIPVAVDGITFALDAAIGVSLAPLHGDDRHTLLKRADIAMYAAKDRPNNPIALYEPSQQRWTAREIGLLEDLRRALDADELTLAYQPKTSLMTGRVFGVEALCRWNHRELGPIRPDEFIGLAEQGGLIDELTAFVLRTALTQARVWLDEGLHIDVAVNLPAKALGDPTLAPRMAALASTYGVPPTMLTLEVTESQLVEDARSSREVMATLRSHGFRVSIDDFGTGYSSLAYLHTLPVDELKIDRAFVRDVATDHSSRQIVHVIVELAKTFGLKTVAEGIETQDVHDALRDLGVELGQGFLMARPAPASELGGYLRAGFEPAVRHSQTLALSN